jgi:hypothetical protein
MGARKGVAFLMGKVLRRAQDEFVPVDQGDLRDSGTLTVSAKGLSATISFSGPAAVPIHEHLSSASPRSWKRAEEIGHGVHFQPPGRGPKYLEKPLLEMADEAKEQLREFIWLEKL